MAALLCWAQSVWAEEYKTAGDGMEYSFSMLAQLAGTGVEQQGDDYVVSQNLTIAEGDRFRLDDGVTIRFAQNVRLTIEGEADFQQTVGTTFTRATDVDVIGASIRIQTTDDINIKKCMFYYVGLELMGDGGVNVQDCNFFYHDGSQAAALYFISTGRQSIVEDCRFEACQKAAIGSPVNAMRPLVVHNCTLIKNSAANGNVPQINVSAAQGMQITDCTIIGNPENNMVGGIGISNFMMYDADLLITGCTIEDNRYGIGTVGPIAHVVISHNQLRNNKYETNPLNGGSGISLYDSYQQTKAVITGNHIEGSLWGITIIGCQDVNIGRTDVPEMDERYNVGGNVFKDNGNDGVLYDLYNNSPNTVYAQGNIWNVSQQTQEQIETVIFHKVDDANLGEVIFWPAASPTGIDRQAGAQDQRPFSRYNLHGVRIGNASTPTSQLSYSKGIYIINGKKTVL